MKHYKSTLKESRYIMESHLGGSIVLKKYIEMSEEYFKEVVEAKK